MKSSSSYPPRTGFSSSAGAVTDRVGVEPARPVSLGPSGAALPRHFQSDAGFATLENALARAQRANRRSDRLLARVQLGLAIVAIAWAVLPPLLMALAGGTPA